MKKRILSFLMAAALLFVLAVPTFAEESHAYTYIALGDSITAGIGLLDTPYQTSAVSGYDMTQNYHGYSDDCYVAEVAEGLGLDRDHAINYGLPGVTSADMVDLLASGSMPARNLYRVQYQLDDLLPLLREADLITLQVGSNDTLAPVVMAIGQATNQKSSALLTTVMTGALREFNCSTLRSLLKGLRTMTTLTCSEWKALRQLLSSGIAEICATSYTDTTANLQKCLQELRALNPTAQILVLGYYDLPEVLPSWNASFKQLNQYLAELAPQYNATYVAIPRTSIAADAHPTVLGHAYIARQILSTVQK